MMGKIFTQLLSIIIFATHFIKERELYMEYEWLLLNQPAFEVGDTICGRLRMKGKRGKSHYSLKGDFKAIVEKGVKAL